MSLPQFYSGKCTVLIILIVLLSACADKDLDIFRQVPIQMARVTQTDSYSQTFIIDSPAIREAQGAERDKALDEKMDNIFIHMIGAKNWQHLKNLYGISSLRNELISRRIHIDGLISFTIYLDPLDLDFIIIEGSGRYFAVRDETEAILMSGDFIIPPQRYAIKALKSGCLPLDSKLYITRIPGKTTYYKDTLVRYDLIIDTSNARRKAYSIDYSTPHSGYIDMNGDGEYDADVELFASLKLNDRYHQAKLFDIQGLQFIKQNYRISQEAKLNTALAKKEDQHRQCVIHRSDETTQTGEEVQ